MRTIEEVREHLECTGYNPKDMDKIFSFLQKRYGQEALSIHSNDLNYGAFLEWFFDEDAEDDEMDYEAVDNEADKIISELEELLKKKGFTSITINADPSDEVCKTALDFCKEQKMRALEELERSEKQLEEKIADMSDERMKGIATKMLNFAKELKEEVKKKINE